MNLQFSCLTYLVVFAVHLVGSEHDSTAESSSGHTEKKHTALRQEVLDQSAGLKLTWSYRHAKKDAMLFAVSIAAETYNWWAFGFTDKDDRDEDIDDVLVVWLDRNGKLRHKDCHALSEDGRLHVDKHQDYFLSKKSQRRSSLNVTFHRLMKTVDQYDLPIEAGEVHVVWSYGMSSSFKRISYEYFENRKSRKIVLVEPDNVDKAGGFVNKGTSAVDEKPVVPSIKPEKEKIKEVAPTKEVNSLLAVKLKHTKMMKDHINCTVIIQRSQDWYKVLKMKENSVYYAIIGSAALLTGMIVLTVACCCAKKRVIVSPKQKVAFYKVDDYDDEQIEFLRERATKE